MGTKISYVGQKKRGNQESGKMVPWKLPLNNSENEGYGVKAVAFKLALFPSIPKPPNCVTILLILLFN